MRFKVLFAGIWAGLLLGFTGVAQATEVGGCVILDEACDGVFDESDPGVDLVRVVITLPDNTFVAEAFSDITKHGAYEFKDLAPEVYLISVEPPPGLVFGSADCTSKFPERCMPLGNPTTIDLTTGRLTNKLNFLLCTPPEPGNCWMTGGGVKFELATETWNAVVSSNGNRQNRKGNGNDNGPSDSVGGVVFPSCDQAPSNGGNWNHVQHSTNQHLLGKDVYTVRCGNVDGIEEGTESPVCDVNFIEFYGEGTVQPVGNADFEPIEVTFFGRVEDRNEPGNERGQPQLVEVDRYFLIVKDLDGNTVMLVDADGVDDGAVDPLTITGGNFQIHCTSCEDGDGGGGSVRSRYAEGLERGTFFLRGDLNTDGTVNVADAIFGLNYLFHDGAEPRCMDATDVNDDGALNVTDSVALLNALFAGGPIFAPFPLAGVDRTPDALDCALLVR